jgi:ABC-type dipeptide/oligopeptide/nickel transport system permease subunit
VDPVDEVTYWSIVWEQFKKNRLAYWGMWAVVGMLLTAVFAPVLCLEQPFMITYADPQSGEAITAYPWFESLLFDRNLFENAVDVFFNLLLVLSPLIVATGVGLRAFLKTKPRKERMQHVQRFALGWVAVSFLALAVLLINPSSKPFQDYVKIYNTASADAEAQIAVLKLKGEGSPARFAELRDQIPSAVFPPIPQSVRKSDLGEVLEPINSAHLLGTDDRGRDVFARMLYGTRISVTIGVVAVSIYMLIGIVLGALAGFFGGKVDALVLRLIEVMLCFPSLILIMTLVAFVEKPSIFHVMLIIGVTRWTGPARLIRGEFLKLKGQDFVSAATAAGLTRSRVIFRHVLPNALSPVLVAATFGVASAILIESTLAFLGLGDASAPSWGETLNLGRLNNEMRMILAPGFAIFVTVSLFNLVGEGVRDALDPKLRR